jgi:hypothetical protein
VLNLIAIAVALSLGLDSFYLPSEISQLPIVYQYEYQLLIVVESDFAFHL